MSGAPLGLLAFGIVAGSMALWFQRIRAVRIPDDRRPFVASWLAGAALGAFALFQAPGWLGGVLGGTAAFVGAFFSLLVYVSPQRVGDDAIRVGEPLRDFGALDENGERFEIASLAGRPILLKFFRGHW